MGYIHYYCANQGQYPFNNKNNKINAIFKKIKGRNNIYIVIIKCGKKERGNTFIN